MEDLMGNKTLTETSKFLSYILRHKPQAIGITLDNEGWVDVSALIEGAARYGRALDETLIREVVAGNDKKRFSLSPDGARIRAAQGHSTTQVNLQHVQKVPPERLYHGTASRFLESIRRQGLIPGSRHHVHLSDNPDTARAVGKRYGTPVILNIRAQDMHQQGHRFFQADNGVWLVERVPRDFISETTIAL
jgi:putative RNA 2'-phosphotransferase